MKLVLAFFIIIILSNFIGREPDCKYSNYSGSFTFSEMNFKERNFRACKTKFAVFKNTGNTDTILYRVSCRNYWQFWNYQNYLTSAKYKLPYLSWEDVESRRGTVINKTGFQDF